MKSFKDNIEEQLEFNRGKNLFHRGILDSLKFSQKTVNEIEKIVFIDSDTENLLINYLTDRSVLEFCQINQYYVFDHKAKLTLRNLYVDLFVKIRERKTSIDLIAENHYNNLIKWLQQTNTFAEKIYAASGEKIESVPCYEYSPELQLEILQIDMNKLTEPILDIGCGKEGNLVLFLRKKGLNAYGLDRFVSDSPFLNHSDWFEFNFEKSKWGTIVSNLGFSNHFQHHHLRSDGEFVNYARKFMEILNALKIGGCFHYAPDLPFIEQYLDKDRYQLRKHAIGNYGFRSTVIQRIV